MSAIPSLHVDLIAPNCGDLMFYGVRVTKYRDGQICNVVERDYYISTPTDEAVEDLLSFCDYGKTGSM